MRDADCAGPTKMHRMSPRTQKALGPRSWRKNTPSPARDMHTSDTTMTFFAPIRSSSTPKEIVAMPATTLATMPKTMTCPGEKPKVPAAMIPPKVKTPASPSRKTAEARRNHSVCGLLRHSPATVRHSAR